MSGLLIYVMIAAMAAVVASADPDTLNGLRHQASEEARVTALCLLAAVWPLVLTYGTGWVLWTGARGAALGVVDLAAMIAPRRARGRLPAARVVERDRP